MSLGEHSATDTLGDLQGKGDKFTKLHLIETKKYEDLRDAISFILKETDKYRDKAKTAAIDVMNIHILTPNPAYSRADGVNISREAQMVTTKTLKILEAKLNKLLQRKSEIIHIVKQKKELINHYRRMRIQTDISHEKYKENIKEAKEHIEAFLAESAKVVEDRQSTLEKKVELERLNVEEQQRFQERYEEMGRFIKAQNDALENSLLQERKADRSGTTIPKASNTTTTNNNASSNNLLAGFDGGMAPSNLTLEEEVALAKNVSSLTSAISIEQKNLAELKQKISTYESMFEQLKKMTGVENLEDMVANYIQQEEEMFSMYNYIQTAIAEIDSYTESKLRTEQEIVEYKQDQASQEEQRRKYIDDLQQRVQTMLHTTMQLSQENDVKQECINQIAKKVNSVFYKLQCDQVDAKAGGGGTGGGNSKSRNYGSSGVRQDAKIAMLTSQSMPIESIVLDLLGCIEQRAIDIVSDYLRVVNSKEAAGIIAQVNSSSPNNNTTNNAALSAAAAAAAKASIMLNSGNRSPTPGPATPMIFGATAKREAAFNVDEISDDEFLANLEAMVASEKEPSSLNTHARFEKDTAMVAKEKEKDDERIMDVSSFRHRLEKRLANSASQPGPSSPGGFFPSTTNKSRK